MANQDKRVWQVIQRIVQMREDLHRVREQQNAELRAAIEAIARPRLPSGVIHCGGRGRHAAYAMSNIAAK